MPVIFRQVINFGMFTAQVGLRVEASDVRTHLEETNSGSNNFYIDFFLPVHTTFQVDSKNSLQLATVAELIARVFGC